MKNIYLLVVLLLTCSVYSQNRYSVSGKLVDDTSEGIPFANVLLLQPNDSTLVKGTLTTELGTYEFTNIQEGEYVIQGSFVGYQTANSEVFTLSENKIMPTITLSEGETLSEVVVVAEKPLFSQKVDRLVINVESSIVSAGGSALEILERSPGVTVNRQNSNISVVGKDGVVVMINGKVSYVPTSSLVQFLEGMSADNIKSIELITTPPANFDAEGNAGFINIVLKESADIGLNGSYSFSAGVGEGELTTSNSLSFNYRKDKLNLFGSYSYALDKRPQVFTFLRDFSRNDTVFTTSTITDRAPRQRNHNLRVGIDVDISEKTVMGFLLSAFDNRWSMDAFNKSIDSENGTPVGFVTLVNDEINRLQHFGANYNIKHNFNEDTYLSFDLDYLFYEFDNPTNYVNSFFDANNNPNGTELTQSRKNTPINTWVGKLDFSKKINDSWKYEAGIKGTTSKFENDVSVAFEENGQFITDPDFTNFSELDEQIYAGYIASEYTIDEKTTAKAGLRYEFTDSKLDVSNQGTVVDREFGKLFPSAFVNRKFTEDLSMNLSYTRRITRPTFNDLAPFVIFIDPNTFISGNASLQPAISDAYKYDINYKSYFLSFQYTHEDNSISGFQPFIDPETGRLIVEAANLDYTNTFSIVAGFPLKIAPWFRTQNNLSFIKQNLRTFYNNSPIEIEVDNFRANSTFSFKLSDTFSAELSGFYNSPSLSGLRKSVEVYGINFGLQKKFGDRWGTLKFSINDVFDTVIFKENTYLPDENINIDSSFDFVVRTFSVTYSRSFGNSKLKSERKRETGSEDERRRVN